MPALEASLKYSGNCGVGERAVASLTIVHLAKVTTVHFTKVTFIRGAKVQYLSIELYSS